MLRITFVLVIFLIGSGYALRGPFYALLLYLWIAYFRPESWVWTDLILTMNLSFAAGIYLIFRAFFSGVRFTMTARTLLVLMFLAHSLLSTVLSPYFNVSWPIWRELAKSIIVMYLITVVVTDLPKFRLTILIISLSLALEGAKQGWAQLLLNTGAKNANPIPFLGDENGVAQGMLMLLPLLVALAQTASSLREKLFHRILAIGVLYRAISTYSRGGFLGCGILAVLHLWQSPRKLRTLCGAAVVALAIASALPQEYWDRMGTITTEEEEMDESAAGRVHFWRVATRMAADYPLTGVGIKAFASAYDRYDFSGGYYGSYRNVHSAWFGALAELGYTGFLLFVGTFLLTLGALWRLRRQLRHSSHPDAADIRAYASALQSSFGVYFVTATFLSAQYSEMFWHFIGLTIALEVIAAGALAESALSPFKGVPPLERFTVDTAAAYMPLPERTAAWR